MNREQLEIEGKKEGIKEIKPILKSFEISETFPKEMSLVSSKKVTNNFEVSKEEKLGVLRQKIEAIKPKDPNKERLLDDEYNLDDLPEGSYRKKTLLEMKAYYEKVRQNIEIEPVKELLDEKEKKIAKSIDSLPITDSDKVCLILVWRKLKPATDLHILNQSKGVRSWLTEKKVKKTLTEMGLHYDEDFYPEHDNCRVFMLSPDKSTFNIMRSENARYKKFLEDRNNDPQKKHLIDYEKAGMFYGFPKTAIMACVASERAKAAGKNADVFVSNDMLPPEIRKIKSFGYSKDNWEKESQTSIRWAKEISLISPELYKRAFEQ